MLVNVLGDDTTCMNTFITSLRPLTWWTRRDVSEDNLVFTEAGEKQNNNNTDSGSFQGLSCTRLVRTCVGMGAQG